MLGLFCFLVDVDKKRIDRGRDDHLKLADIRLFIAKIDGNLRNVPVLQLNLKIDLF